MNKIESIQLLRTFAAISVILTHISFVKSGSYGVDIFFIISGFLMMYSTEKGLEKYWRKKVFRIVPFYWFMTIVTAIAVAIMPNLFNSYEVSGIYLLKSLCFMPYEHNGIHQPILGLGYTLNYEMLFYLIFFVSAQIAKKINYKIRGWVCTFIILCMVVVGRCNLPMPFSFWCNTLILEFVVGIVLYYLFDYFCINQKIITINRFHENFFGLLIIISIVFLWNTNIFAEGIIRIICWGGMSALLFVAVYIYFYKKEIPSLFLLIGNVSYYIYLSHPYCVRLTEKIVFRFIGKNVVGYVFVVVISVSSSLVCGYCLKKAFEKIIKSN